MQRATPRSIGASPFGSGAELEEADVAVLDDILLALRSNQTLLAQRRLRLVLVDVAETIHIRLDEPLLEIGVDDARGLRPFHTLRDRPRAHLVLARGEIAL